MNEKDTNIIYLKHVSVQKIANKIILVKAVKNGVIDDVEVKEAIVCSQKLAEYKPYHSIIDTKNFKQEFTQRGKDFYKEYSEGKHLKISQSVIYNTLGAGLMIGAIYKLINAVSPHKFFINQEDALKWIKSIDPEAF